MSDSMWCFVVFSAPPINGAFDHFSTIRCLECSVDGVAGASIHHHGMIRYNQQLIDALKNTDQHQLVSNHNGYQYQKCNHSQTMQLCKNMCTCDCAHVCTYEVLHMCALACTCVCVRVCVCGWVGACTRGHACTHMCDIHSCVHVHMCQRLHAIPIYPTSFDIYTNIPHQLNGLHL